MKSHTPGPWLREGTIVYTLEHHGWRKGKEEFRNRFSVQIVRGPDISDEETEANARLIQAAPDMHDALVAILFQVIQGPVLERDACITQARAALAKTQRKTPEPCKHEFFLARPNKCFKCGWTP